jgi:aspartyl-tRNA(Asn)/glutamyl-tRNA(Gln) amidotransferase subunit A
MIYLDDSIMRKGLPATAGSKMLENFIAPFDAEVVTRLKGEELQSVKLAEFGLGDPGLLPEDGMMLCNDVFGHVRRQADKQGLCYIRPAYGTVSRHGLIQTAASMDQIGIVCKDPSEGFAMLDKIAEPCRGAHCASVNNAILSDVHEQVLYILAYAEISSNLSRYDGVKFGFRAAGYKGLEDLYAGTRTEGFGLEAKLALIMGCLLLSQENYTRYYEKAMKLRRMIKDSLDFSQTKVQKHPVDSPLAVLCGLPSVTFNGVQLIAASMEDIRDEI